MIKIFCTVIAGIILFAATAGATGVIRSYINENNITNIYIILGEIKTAIKENGAKIDKLRDK